MLAFFHGLFFSFPGETDSCEYKSIHTVLIQINKRKELPYFSLFV